MTFYNQLLIVQQKQEILPGEPMLTVTLWMPWLAKTWGRTLLKPWMQKLSEGTPRLRMMSANSDGSLEDLSWLNNVPLSFNEQYFLFLFICFPKHKIASLFVWSMAWQGLFLPPMMQLGSISHGLGWTSSRSSTSGSFTHKASLGTSSNLCDKIYSSSFFPLEDNVVPLPRRSQHLLDNDYFRGTL